MTTGGGKFEYGKTAGDLPDLAYALRNADSRRGAFDVLVPFVRSMGFTDLMLTVEANGVRSDPGETRWTTLNDTRLAALDAAGFDGRDALRRSARRTLDPLVWVTGQPSCRDLRSSDALMGELHNAGIDAGMTTAVWGRAGRGGVLDAFGPAALVRALSRSAAETFYLAAAMTFRAIERLSLVEGGANLTKREVEILDLASQGLTARGIAGRLAIAEPTVKFHLKGIREKLSVRTKSEAIARFAALDLSAHLPESGKTIEYSTFLKRAC